MSKIIRQSLVFFIFFIISSLSIASEEGLAAYYSDVFQGKMTASGKSYDRNKFTAAHRTLAFGTKVEVTDLKNDKSVTVIITDRMPRNKKRIIDLSYAAAEEIGLIKAGISEVRIDTLQ